MDLLNLGCGARFHPAWVNVDLVSYNPAVVAHDIRRPLPFGAGSFDAVYHSHVLEHLPPGDGKSLLDECHRVLRSGGVIRVVVPDLEAIARQYLAALERAAQGDEAAPSDHDWMTVELIDQMVRTESGGEMKRWFSDPHIPNRLFVEKRVGSEMTNRSHMAAPSPAVKKRRPYRSPVGRLKRFWGRVRRRLSHTALAVLEGQRATAILREATFRQSGEVHRWMYDRVSLARALNAAGFKSISVQTALSSGIPDFATYNLDTHEGQVRKPDSLFIEGVKAR